MRSRGLRNTSPRAHNGAKFRPLLNANDLGIRTAAADIGVASVYKRSFIDQHQCKSGVMRGFSASCARDAVAVCRCDPHSAARAVPDHLPRYPFLEDPPNTIFAHRRSFEIQCTPFQPRRRHRRHRCPVIILAPTSGGVLTDTVIT